ncbi:MAG: hypothetical protein FJX47_18975 [Alphaproteobacteria bacterium]|nr:hypothetical protein [Alphaproteobacteria bacterium]
MSFPAAQRQALSILAKSTEAVLGNQSPVCRAIDKAIRSEEDRDLDAAAVVFDSLPKGKRGRIGQAADMHARVYRKLRRAKAGRSQNERVVAALQQLGLRRVTMAKPWAPRRRLDGEAPTPK